MKTASRSLVLTGKDLIEVLEVILGQHLAQDFQRLANVHDPVEVRCEFVAGELHIARVGGTVHLLGGAEFLAVEAVRDLRAAGVRTTTGRRCSEVKWPGHTCVYQASILPIARSYHDGVPDAQPILGERIWQAGQHQQCRCSRSKDETAPHGGCFVCLLQRPRLLQFEVITYL